MSKNKLNSKGYDTSNFIKLSSKKKKLRPLGDILLDLEVVLDEAIEQHDLQWGDVLGLVHQWLVIHHPKSQEEYTDGTNPKFYYGSKK